MPLPKAHHIETLSEFNSLKFSYDSTNTHYFTGGTSTIVEGTPDILYTDIAYIKPLSCIYTHAKIYPCPVLEYDNTPTANSTNLVNSGNIKNAIDGAISGKQDTLTFDSTPTANSTNPVTSGGIKAAIDSAIGGVPNALKQVDLTTYQGTDGEIVQHTGATTANYVNGWNYKFTAGQSTSTAACGTLPNTYDASVIPNDYTTKINSLIYAAKPVMMDSIGVSVALYTSNDVYKDVLKDSQYSVGDRYGNDFRAGNIISSNETDTKITISVPNMWGSTAEVEFLKSTLQTFPLFRERKTNLLFALVPKGGDEYKIVGFDEDYRQQYTWQSANDVTFTESSAQGGWQQWNSQPSSAADVSALQQRMTAAETAISGKQPTITGAASTITDSNLTASKILGSDPSGKVAETSIATADAEDAVAKRHTQNTDTKIQSGNNKVEVSASGTAVTGNASVSGSLSVSGNLNVTGKETVEEIVNIKSENNFITLRDGAQTAIASGSLSGTKVENYDGLGNDLLFGTDASGVFRIGDEGGTLEPIATRDEAANLTDGQLMKWDAANQRMVGINDIRANTVNGAPLSNAASYFYGVSTSAANATQKEVSIPSITTLNAGQVIVVLPTVNSNTINNATLKLNDFVDYPIVRNNVAQLNSGYWFANIPTTLVFSGDKWILLAWGWDSSYTALSVSEGTAGTGTTSRVVRADYLQQIIHGQIDKFVGTRAMTEDDYWDLVTAGTVQADTLYITFDNDYSED